MVDEMEAQSAAMDEIKKMLKDGLAARLAKLAPGASLEVSIKKPGEDDSLKADDSLKPDDGMADEKPAVSDLKSKLMGVDEKADLASPDGDEPDEDDTKDMHPLQKLAMAKLNQIVRPKKG